MEFNVAFVFFKSFSAKHGKKGKEKRNHYSVIEQNAIKRQPYGKYLKGLHPKMTGQNDLQDKSLTGQVHDQAGHCPLTGCYFEPCTGRQFVPLAKILGDIFIFRGTEICTPFC